ncbi:GH3 family domain-containing protein [Legionella maioricensis]|uniref:GH3 auxin-responsive promoter family protein n=1 Tax=Legionella maioricensis TaxID=2896528 RepID=A0A9X2D1F0_9GAMM|nr:GH3 auxin-responsive promoter family protein [Legionella maioricensis]MCL9684716.1 GH3 auxin-responsive promoter family protein [Legionella maioricensis]MCL9687744.1 GH3 auxin-responsive promoter family protein [Legionella maioricensis]
MNWKRLLIAAVTRGKYKAFLDDTRYPELAKLSLWTDEILPLLEKSPYWQPLLQDKNTILLDDFDITTYEDYEQGLLEAQNSHIQPFNGEKIIFWSETSGTAGVRKFFPITASFQLQFQRTMAPYIYNLTQLFSGFFKEKILYLVAVDANKTTPAGTPSGWISNFNYRNLPAFIKRFYAMPDEVFANTEVYTQWAPLYALATDLSALFAVTPMVIEAFYERCSNEFLHYLPYLTGEQSIPSELPPVKMTRKRRRYLQGLAKNSKPAFKELWPSLQVAGCWTSGLCEYPAQQLQKQMGADISLVDGTYSATEGWLTVPLDTGKGGILHPGAHIFEFIEEGQAIDKDNLLQCWELEVGKRYEVFLTTAMGFVRYRLKDIVECTGFLNKAPKLVFCYKTQLLKLESCAITGQELQAMLKAVHFNMEPYWYFARNSLGNMIVLVTDNTVEIPDSMLPQMHEQLIQISPTYAHSVDTGEVLPIVLLQVPKDTLLADSHAQTKPKLISQQVISER